MTICGTPEYIAPEALRNNKEGYSHSVDVWAFGILIHEMIMGMPPFYDSSPMRIYRKILKAEVVLPSCLNNATLDIITKTLQKCPSKRM